MCAARFADFDDSAGGERWAASVRPFCTDDVQRVAELVAERDECSIEAAREVVARWLGGSDRIVVVAERAGRVAGYGKAEWLDPSAGGGSAPTGWYLAGMVVAPAARRHGLGTRLTEERIRLLAELTDEVWYFANVGNAPTVALHERFGFVEHARDFTIPGVTFSGGEGALFRLQFGRGVTRARGQRIVGT